VTRLVRTKATFGEGALASIVDKISGDDSPPMVDVAAKLARSHE
jgi:hypothetical protein